MIGKGKRNARREEAKKATDSGAVVGTNCPAMIRLRKEFAEIDLPSHAKVNVPVADDLMNFEVTIDLSQEKECLWYKGIYKFTIKVPFNYPHEPPKCTCETKIYHPNIDREGAVCLNILRADWKPVLGVNPVILGLIFLFIEPNPNDPLNHEAAGVLRQNPQEFARRVGRSLRGETIDGITHHKFI